MFLSKSSSLSKWVGWVGGGIRCRCVCGCEWLLLFHCLCHTFRWNLWWMCWSVGPMDVERGPSFIFWERPQCMSWLLSCTSAKALRLSYMCCTYHYCAVSPSLMQIILAFTHVLFSAPSFACCHSTLFLPISLPQLWPLFGGQMVKPQKNKLLYISQAHWLMELVQLGIVNAKEWSQLVLQKCGQQLVLWVQDDQLLHSDRGM